MRRALLLISIALAATAGCGPASVGLDLAAAQQQPVVAGVPEPEELGVELNRFEKNAVVANLVDHYGQVSQGCTGTLVGDRLVVSAAHCVILNREAWLYDDAEPEVVPAEEYTASVGADVRDAECQLQAEAIHLHPEIAPIADLMQIEHDISVIVLRESALQRCPGAVPVQLNRDPIGEELRGVQLLQGGFGSLDGSYNFSPQRRWSLVNVSRIDDAYLTVTDQGQGFPTFGDSGSGVLMRGEGGALKNLGVSSSWSGPAMNFARADVSAAGFDHLFDEERVCGAVDAIGTCREGAAISCGAAGFTVDDCRARDLECQLDADGAPECGCACDSEPFCQEECPCDRQCPCECDHTFACDGDCDCDPECATAETDPEGVGCGSLPAATAGRGPQGLLALLLLLPLSRRRSHG